MRETTHVTVFSEIDYQDNWPPSNAIEFISWLTEKIELIPIEYRKEAIIDINSQHGYDETTYADIKIYYTRPETDEEMADREALEDRCKKLVIERELLKLVELKAKYEPKCS